VNEQVSGNEEHDLKWSRSWSKINNSGRVIWYFQQWKSKSIISWKGTEF